MRSVHVKNGSNFFQLLKYFFAGVVIVFSYLVIHCDAEDFDYRRHYNNINTWPCFILDQRTARGWSLSGTQVLFGCFEAK